MSTIVDRIESRNHAMVARKPQIVFHADWSSNAKKRWGAKATLGADGRYIASGPFRVGETGLILGTFQSEAGIEGCVFAGFDFPIGVPIQYAQRVGISGFRDFLFKLDQDEWVDFYLVCDGPEQITIHRPFYPNRSKKGCVHQHLFDAHHVVKMEPLLRQSERGGKGRKEACSLFWTLGPNQVGKQLSTVEGHVASSDPKQCLTASMAI